MNSIEKLLQQMSLSAPSDELDARIAEVLVRAPTGSQRQSLRGSARRGIPWSLSLIVAVACLIVGIGIGQRWPREPKPETTRESSRAMSVKPDESDPTTVAEGTFILLNGIYPARHYQATVKRRIQVYDEETGKSHEVVLPIVRDVFAQSHGI